MSLEVNIRSEVPSDYRNVEELVRDAFWNGNEPGCDEHYLLHKMRSHHDHIGELAFVAESEGRIVGHIAYTKSTITTSAGVVDTVTFGPISVSRSSQRQGIGRKLVDHSTSVAASLGYKSVLIYGDPRYYGRLGFRCAETFDITNPSGYFCACMLAMELQPGHLKSLGGGSFRESILFENFKEDLNAFEEFEATFPSKVKEVTPQHAEFQVLVSLKYKKTTKLSLDV